MKQFHINRPIYNLVTFSNVIVSVELQSKNIRCFIIEISSNDILAS